jgi:N-methylhydantoinase A
VRAPEVRIARLDGAGQRAAGPAPRARPAWCFARGEEVEFTVCERDRLHAGRRFPGPAIVDEGTSSTVVMSDQTVQVDPFGHLLIRQEDRS